MSKKKMTVVLIVYNRADKTQQTLEALKRAKTVDQCNLLVVQQIGSEEVTKLVNDISWIETTHHLTQYPECTSVKYRINSNVRKGLESAFAEPACEYALILEDDILLGFDFLHFCNVMHERYRDDPKFKGINAFSKEGYSESLLWSYGQFRYGVGKGWSISRKQWEAVQKYWIPGVDQHFDYLIEEWTREGFVVMPYCSRSLDIGWGEGSSHGPKDEFDEHWVAMRKSWVGSDPFPLQDYQCFEDMPFSWRSDCVPYKNNFSQLFSLYRLKAKNTLKRILKR
ncbi:GNT-I family protein [Jezberella montanilacus]|uniref:GNT-I family protein n=1 Tax=Jezberella montanilacus TaxID=323426 RepID=A0A2T0XI92_9BURK|nr:hypothetical protein [Jezberella montanilacus]PRY98668.1 GNT-I family protein [Jezberella montanilacus]